jgi:hypothetical protein
LTDLSLYADESLRDFPKQEVIYLKVREYHSMLIAKCLTT